MTNQLFLLDFCAVRQDTNYPHQDFGENNFYQKSSPYFFGWSFRNWKVAACLQLAENWNISTKVWQSLLFYQHSQPLYHVMQKEVENLEFVQGMSLELIDSLKNNGTKYFLKFDDSCEEIRNSRAIIDIATAGRHRSLSTICIKHNLFQQSKVGGDAELQNTHIVLFKSPRDVLQVTTLGAKLSLGAEIVDWCRDATPVPFGHLMIDLSPRTDNRLRYCTNSGSVPSKIYFPERLKPLRFLDEDTKSIYPPNVPIALLQMQKPLSSVLRKRDYPVSMRIHSKSIQRKLANHKKTSRAKVSRRRLVTIAKKNNLETKKKRSVVRKRIATTCGQFTSLL